MLDLDINNKVAIITGATSGIGRAVCLTTTTAAAAPLKSKFLSVAVFDFQGLRLK